MNARIYYDTGEVYDDDIEQAPPLGVLVITQEVRGKRTILHTRDFYWFKIDEGYFEGSDQFGMMDQLLHNRKNVGKVLAGRTVDVRTLQTAMQRAVKENK